MAKILENFGFLSQQSEKSSRRSGRSSEYTKSGRRSTGRHPGTVTDPERDGRLHHGDLDVGMGGEKLLTKEEWLASHHVPHPGARGNRNAAGPHQIPPESMKKIKEGGRKGGKAHLGMKFKRTDFSSNMGSSYNRQRDINEARALSERLREVLSDLSS